MRTEGAHPEQLASHAAAYFRDHLIVYGGTGVPFGQSSSNRIHACDLRTGVWQWLRPDNTDQSQVPTDQYGQAIVVDSEANCLYAIGGTTGYSYTIDVFKFCLFTRKWSLLWKRHDSDHDVFPRTRYRHEVVLYDKRIYVFGGGTASTCYGFKFIPVFDLSTNSWIKLQSNPLRPKAPVPAARKCHGCVKTSSDHVYIMGGSDGSTIFGDIWRFDLKTAAWLKIPIQMPVPLYFHGISISPVDRVTVFGGVNRISSNQMDTDVRTNDIYEVWLEVPPLQELAWLSFVHHSDPLLLVTSSRLQLAQLGIPTRYLNRLTLTPRDATSDKELEASSEHAGSPLPQPS